MCLINIKSKCLVFVIEPLGSRCMHFGQEHRKVQVNYMFIVVHASVTIAIHDYSSLFACCHCAGKTRPVMELIHEMSTSASRIRMPSTIITQVSLDKLVAFFEWSWLWCLIVQQHRVVKKETRGQSIMQDHHAVSFL